MKVSDFGLSDPGQQLECISWHETLALFPFLCKLSPAALSHSPYFYKLSNMASPFKSLHM